MGNLLSWHRRMRWLLGVAVLAILGPAVLDAWVLNGLVRPVRVVSGSMSPSFSGPRYEVRCLDCGRMFGWVAESSPEGEFATCPNCGFKENAVSQAVSQAGERVLIDRSRYWVHVPQRWDAVAFEDVNEDGRLVLKRIVGLPGEEIEIRRGDVWADGKLVRKNLRQWRALAIEVHDDRYRSRQLSPRWQSTRAASRWRATSNGYTFGGDEQAPWASVEILATSKDTSAAANGPDGEKASNESAADDNTPDVLVYQHLPSYPSPAPRNRVGGITDHCGGNQRQSGPVHLVPDVGLSCHLSLTSPNQVSFQVLDGAKQFVVTLDAEKSVVTLHEEGSVVAEHTIDNAASRLAAGVTWEVALCDEQLLVGLDEEAIIAHPFTRQTSNVTSSRPFSIVAEEGGVVIRNLRILRDVHYLDAYGHHDAWSSKLPPGNSYFMLGDNTPLSQDSRHEDGVAHERIVGRVLKQ